MLLALISEYGIIGAIIAPFLSDLVNYPVSTYFVRQYRGWYPVMDLTFSVVGAVIIAVVLWASPAAQSLLTSPFM
jgi:uncharacterized membrane protein YeaQ/YmgE (transglycosylase-associated protein family)